MEFPGPPKIRWQYEGCRPGMKPPANGIVKKILFFAFGVFQEKQ